MWSDLHTSHLPLVCLVRWEGTAAWILELGCTQYWIRDIICFSTGLELTYFGLLPLQKQNKKRWPMLVSTHFQMLDFNAISLFIKIVGLNCPCFEYNLKTKSNFFRFRVFCRVVRNHSEDFLEWISCLISPEGTLIHLWWHPGNVNFPPGSEPWAWGKVNFPPGS